MTKTELESKHLSDLHQLAAAAGVERYRMLTRAELIERLSDGDGGGDSARRSSRRLADGGEERARALARRRRAPVPARGSGRGGREREGPRRRGIEDEDEKPRRRAGAAALAARRPRAPIDAERARSRRSGAASDATPRTTTRARARAAAAAAGAVLRPPPRRGSRSRICCCPPSRAARRCCWPRPARRPPSCCAASPPTSPAASDGPDPVALLIDPSPEELADWKREAPQAELVSAGQARHATDALATAQRRAADGEDVILLVDSLTRFADVLRRHRRRQGALRRRPRRCDERQGLADRRRRARAQLRRR